MVFRCIVLCTEIEMYDELISQIESSCQLAQTEDSWIF